MTKPASPAGDPRVSLTDPHRFVWHLLAQDDAQEVVVFDQRLGLTHRISGAAHDVNELLVRHAGGLSRRELESALLGPSDDTPQCEAFDRLLEVMVKAQMIDLRPPHAC